MIDDRMLKWFDFSHLPKNLQDKSAPFFLLESKDAAIRAAVHPGG